MSEEENEFIFIGEEMDLLDQIKGSPITAHDRVLSIGKKLESIEKRIKGKDIAFITLLMVSECLSELDSLELELRPLRECKQDE